jgi:hypothetical protein
MRGMKLSALGEEAKDINLRLPDIFNQNDKHYPKPTSYRGEVGQKTSHATVPLSKWRISRRTLFLLNYFILWETKK